MPGGRPPVPSSGRRGVALDRTADARAAASAPAPGPAGSRRGRRRSQADAVQVSDRSHLWHNLCDKALAEVRSHSSCWATVNPPRPERVRERTTRERWHQVHDLLDKGVGLLECARRQGLARNTVKRYARTREPEAMRRAPRYRPTLVGPSRDQPPH